MARGGMASVPLPSDKEPGRSFPWGVSLLYHSVAFINNIEEFSTVVIQCSTSVPR
ncbi:hypothetical protein HMPREF1554_01997 [Porphyromonas gingivalis F0569]|nr:hypothetical protein HMPREF1554_01997 [Porphyromonas gingivalis F0569]